MTTDLDSQLASIAEQSVATLAEMEDTWRARARTTVHRGASAVARRTAVGLRTLRLDLERSAASRDWRAVEAARSAVFDLLRTAREHPAFARPLPN